MFGFIFSLVFLKWAIIVNAVLGALVFYHIWVRTEYHRRDNWIIEKKAISTCRRDIKRWSAIRFFLGSITIALPRFFMIWGIFLGCFIWLK